MTDSAYTVELEYRLYKNIDVTFVMFDSWIPAKSMIRIFGGETGEFIKVTEMGDDYIKFVHMGQQELFIG